MQLDVNRRMIGLSLVNRVDINLSNNIVGPLACIEGAFTSIG